MGILILVALIALVVLVALGIAIYVAKTLGFVAIAVMAAAILAVGYITLFVTGMSFAGLYLLWGEGNAGWAILAALVIGLAVAGSMVRTIANEVRDFSGKIKRWIGLAKNDDVH